MTVFYCLKVLPSSFSTDGAKNRWSVSQEKGPGRPPKEMIPPGKSKRPQKKQRSVATAAHAFFCKIKSWIPHLTIKSGEYIIKLGSPLLPSPPHELDRLEFGTIWWGPDDLPFHFCKKGALLLTRELRLA